MKIQVTQSDIDNGARFRAEHPKIRKYFYAYCPISLAIKRTTESDCVSTGTKFLTFNGKRTKLPNVAMDFVSDFDCGLVVNPFEFDIDI